ncbi:hypothetical protein [Methylomicrobium agile]|uniref:hypothetical protein n=1 Tax=Methylomicrobium agile TaxID=39774 RepID=UPI000315182B|nr:hypothetical protein [Methylomicrobium agile]
MKSVIRLSAAPGIFSIMAGWKCRLANDHQAGHGAKRRLLRVFSGCLSKPYAETGQ